MIRPRPLGPIIQSFFLNHLIDRVAFNAHMPETGTQSYRLRTCKSTGDRKRAS